jgi:hypothetical protein
MDRTAPPATLTPDRAERIGVFPDAAVNGLKARRFPFLDYHREHVFSRLSTTARQQLGLPASTRPTSRQPSNLSS